jgi:hypothetical protein
VEGGGLGGILGDRLGLPKGRWQAARAVGAAVCFGERSQRPWALREGEKGEGAR